MWKLAAVVVAAIAVAGLLWGTLARASRTHAAKAPAGHTNKITVHGRWAITVRDKSGRIVQTRRFENHLTQSGAQKLVDALAGTAIDPGGWQIYLLSNHFLEDIWTTTYFSGAGGNDSSKGLTVSSTTVNGAPALQLKAPEEPLSGGELSVTEVQTLNGSVFTDQVLDPPVTVAAGQSAAVTVTITFVYS